jgi:hypothetical protein
MVCCNNWARSEYTEIGIKSVLMRPDRNGARLVPQSF